jgi:uncharacterized membrane protein YkoI
MRTKLIVAAVGVAAMGTATGVAIASGGHNSRSSGAKASTASRLDDGKSLLPQSGITEQEAIDAARGTGPGALNEVDLEQYKGKLVWNVDVGDRDVKVDAATADVVASDKDD